MSKKNNLIFPISLLIFMAIEIYLLKGRQFQIGIYIYILYAIALFLIDKKYIISLFVFYLPLLPIIPTDFKIFSFVGPHEIIYGFSFFVLLQIFKTNKVKLNKYQKLSITFVYFLFFMDMYVLFKDINLGIYSDPTKGSFYIFKNFVRYFLYYYSLVLLIKVIYTKGIFNSVLNGIKYCLVTLVLSMIYSKQLILMGADIAKKQLFLKHISSNTRFVGFYGAGGDENSAGIFLVGIFGFLLALFEKTGNIKKYIVFLGFAVLGVLLTGSRTSFMALAAVVLIFLVTNKSSSSKFAILASCIIFYVAFSKQLELVIQRFFDPDAAQAVDPGDKKGRFGKWVFYINWLIKNPQTLMFGNLERINFHRAPHNYFIYIIYHVGIVPLFFFFNLLFKLFQNIKIVVKPYELKNVYYILPFPFILMTVNSFGSSIYLWIFLPIGAMLFRNNKSII